MKAEPHVCVSREKPDVDGKQPEQQLETKAEMREKKIPENVKNWVGGAGSVAVELIWGTVHKPRSAKLESSWIFFPKKIVNHLLLFGSAYLECIVIHERLLDGAAKVTQQSVGFLVW